MNRQTLTVIAMLAATVWFGANAAVPGGLDCQGYLTDPSGIAP